MLDLNNRTLYKFDGFLLERSQHGEGTCESPLAKLAVAHRANDRWAGYLISNRAARAAAKMCVGHESSLVAAGRGVLWRLSA